MFPRLRLMLLVALCSFGITGAVARAQINGQCNTAAEVATVTPPAGNLCTAGAPTAMSGTAANPYQWTCVGSGTGHTNMACHAPLASGTTIIGSPQKYTALDGSNSNLLLIQSGPSTQLSQSATVKYLAFYVVQAMGSLQLGIYANPGGSSTSNPGQLLAQTAVFTPVVGWNVQPVQTQVTLPPGNYGLAYNPSDDLLQFEKTNSTGSCSMEAWTAGNGLQSSYSGLTENCTPTLWSFYAIFSAGPPPSPPANVAVPAVTPTSPQVGSAESATTGMWNNCSPCTYAYQWHSGATNVGANSSTYTPVSSDVGNTLTATVTATNTGGSASATSAATNAVTNPPPPPPPANTVLPVISGMNPPQVGSAETVSNGAWTNSPTSYSYQWFSSGNLVGTNGPTYTPVTTDIGKMLSARVTATNAGGTGSATSAMTAAVVAAPPPPAGLHVSGNSLFVGTNQIHLHGVDRSGTEYACIQGWGIFDTSIDVTNDDAQVPFFQAWHANSVLLPLNEDCWLGINGAAAAYSGANYINAIKHEVASLEAAGIYPVLSLHWTAPGTQKATSQNSMPDADHSPAFWQSVANTFKGDANVIFRLQEEPFPAGNSDTAAAWDCWAHGDVQFDASGSLTPISSVSHCSEGFPTVGMQSLLNVIRGTGATNVVAVPGIQYANTTTQFLNSSYRVVDTLSNSQLMAVVDVYPVSNICGSTACYDANYAPVAAVMPFMVGEMGESADGSASTTTNVDTLINWVDAHNGHYSAWDWDTWGLNLQLIQDYTTGNPQAPYGVYYKHRLTTNP